MADRVSPNEITKNVNSLSQLFSKYENFGVADDDNDLQGVPMTGMGSGSTNGEDADFPFLFWDMDDANANGINIGTNTTAGNANASNGSGGGSGNGSGRRTPSNSDSGGSGNGAAAMETVTEDNGNNHASNSNRSPTQNLTPGQNGNGTLNQKQQQQHNISAQEFVNQIANQIAAGGNVNVNALPQFNFANFPFNPNVHDYPQTNSLLAAAAAQGNINGNVNSFQQAAAAINGTGTAWNTSSSNSVNGAAQIDNACNTNSVSNVNNVAGGISSIPQHQQQFVNSVSILPKVNVNGIVSEHQQVQAQAQAQSARMNSMNLNVNVNQQNLQNVNQQPLNAFLGALNPQMLQQQQLYGQVQAQIQSQGNLMLPPHPQQQFQVRMTSSTPQHQQLTPTPSHNQNSQQQQSSQNPNQQNPNQNQQSSQTAPLNNPHLYQSQIIPGPPGIAQNLLVQSPGGGGGKESEQIQPHPNINNSNSGPNQNQSKTSLTSNSANTRKRQLNDSATSNSSTKSNIVSSSDTDCEHSQNSTFSVSKVNVNSKKHRSGGNGKKNNTSSSVADGSFSLSLSQVKDCTVAGISSSLSLSDHINDSFVTDKHAEDLMTEEEKAQANRLRNREHARNTRARKKAYLESLKSTLDELCRERDTLVSERAGAASLLLEMQKTRTGVLLSFFALRSSYEKKRVIWSSILDESIMCVMPVTPYRSFPASEVQISKCQRNVLGIDGMISDAASLHVLLNSLVDRSRFPNGVLQFRYTLIAEEAVVSGNQTMARWSMSTVNAVSLGAKREIGKNGMLCARFNSAHKIVALELMFDVMAFMLQLKQSSGAKAFTMVPNTVQTCIEPFDDTPMVMTLAQRPYTITQVNGAWEEMTLWKSEDVVGKCSCKVLQGERTEVRALQSLLSHVQFQRPASCVFLNYDRQGRMFRNFINIYPLSTDSKITHYVGLTVHYERIDQERSRTSDQEKESKSTLTRTSESIKSEIAALPVDEKKN